MITTVNYDLSLQLTCQLVNLSTKNYELRELHESLSLIRDIRVIRSFFSLRVNKFTSYLLW